MLGDEDPRRRARAIQVFSYYIRLAPLAALVVSFFYVSLVYCLLTFSLCIPALQHSSPFVHYSLSLA